MKVYSTKNISETNYLNRKNSVTMRKVYCFTSTYIVCTVYLCVMYYGNKKF